MIVIGRRMQLFLACSANSLRRVLLFIYSALLLLSLAACRDCDVPAKSETKPDAMVQEDTTTVKIRFLPKWLHQAQFAGIYMANAKGYYRDRDCLWKSNTEDPTIQLPLLLETALQI